MKTILRQTNAFWKDLYTTILPSVMVNNIIRQTRFFNTAIPSSFEENFYLKQAELRLNN